MEKPLETAGMGPKIRQGRAPGNHQSGANSVYQVDEVSDMAPAFWLCGSVRGGFRKGSIAFACLSV